MTEPTTMRPHYGGPAKGAGNGSPRHPDFEKGNTIRKVSGYRMPGKIAEDAAEVRDAIIAADPILAAPRHLYAVEAAAWAVAEARLLRLHLSIVGMFDAHGNPRKSVLDRLRYAETRSARALAAIGFDPASEAKLRRDQSAAVALTGGQQALDALIAKGQQIIAARDGLAELPPATNDDDDHHEEATA